MNYTQITDLALSYSDRESDTEIPPNIDNFLRIVEARINRAFRVSKMSIRSTIDLAVLSPSQEYFGLPTNFGGLRDIEWQNDSDSGSGRCTMYYVSPERMNDIITSNISGNTLYYTLVADQIQMYPVKDTGTLEIIYYQRVIPLTETESTNWIGDDNPDTYVFGLLVEINAFAKDKEASDLWNDRFKISLDEIDEEDKIDRWSGTPLQVRVG